MQAIATSFAESGFRYDQIIKDGMVAIYRQTRIHSGVERYEVVLLTIQKAYTWPSGVTTPEKEAYPPASAWGDRGWTLHSLAEAQAHFATLV